MTDLIKQVGGIEKAKDILSKAPRNAESYQDGYYFRTKPDFLFHNGFHHWNMTTNNGQWFKDRDFNPIPISDLRQAIAEYNTDHCSDIINHVSPSTQVYDK